MSKYPQFRIGISSLHSDSSDSDKYLDGVKLNININREEKKSANSNVATPRDKTGVKSSPRNVEIKATPPTLKRGKSLADKPRFDRKIIVEPAPHQTATKLSTDFLQPKARAKGRIQSIDSDIFYSAVKVKPSNELNPEISVNISTASVFQTAEGNKTRSPINRALNLKPRSKLTAAPNNNRTTAASGSEEDDDGDDSVVPSIEIIPVADADILEQKEYERQKAAGLVANKVQYDRNKLAQQQTVSSQPSPRTHQTLTPRKEAGGNNSNPVTARIAAALTPRANLTMKFRSDSGSSTPELPEAAMKKIELMKGGFKWDEIDRILAKEALGVDLAVAAAEELTNRSAGTDTKPNSARSIDSTPDVTDPYAVMDAAMASLGLNQPDMDSVERVRLEKNHNSIGLLIKFVANMASRAQLRQASKDFARICEYKGGVDLVCSYKNNFAVETIVKLLSLRDKYCRRYASLAVCRIAEQSIFHPLLIDSNVLPITMKLATGNIINATDVRGRATGPGEFSSPEIRKSAIYILSCVSSSKFTHWKFNNLVRSIIGLLDLPDPECIYWAFLTIFNLTQTQEIWPQLIEYGLLSSIHNLIQADAQNLKIGDSLRLALTVLRRLCSDPAIKLEMVEFGMINHLLHYIQDSKDHSAAKNNKFGMEKVCVDVTACLAELTSIPEGHVELDLQAFRCLLDLVNPLGDAPDELFSNVALILGNLCDSEGHATQFDVVPFLLRMLSTHRFAVKLTALKACAKLAAPERSTSASIHSLFMKYHAIEATQNLFDLDSYDTGFLAQEESLQWMIQARLSTAEFFSALSNSSESVSVLNQGPLIALIMRSAFSSYKVSEKASRNNFDQHFLIRYSMVLIANLAGFHPAHRSILAEIVALGEDKIISMACHPDVSVKESFTLFLANLSSNPATHKVITASVYLQAVANQLIYVNGEERKQLSITLFNAAAQKENRQKELAQGLKTYLTSNPLGLYHIKQQGEQGEEKEPLQAKQEVNEKKKHVKSKASIAANEILVITASEKPANSTSINISSNGDIASFIPKILCNSSIFFYNCIQPVSLNDNLRGIIAEMIFKDLLSIIQSQQLDIEIVLLGLKLLGEVLLSDKAKKLFISRYESDFNSIIHRFFLNPLSSNEVKMLVMNIMFILIQMEALVVTLLQPPLSIFEPLMSANQSEIDMIAIQSTQCLQLLAAHPNPSVIKMLNEFSIQSVLADCAANPLLPVRVAALVAMGNLACQPTLTLSLAQFDYIAVFFSVFDHNYGDPHKSSVLDEDSHHSSVQRAALYALSSASARKEFIQSLISCGEALLQRALYIFDHGDLSMRFRCAQLIHNLIALKPEQFLHSAHLSPLIKFAYMEIHPELRFYLIAALRSVASSEEGCLQLIQSGVVRFLFAQFEWEKNEKNVRVSAKPVLFEMKDHQNSGNHNMEARVNRYASRSSEMNNLAINLSPAHSRDVSVAINSELIINENQLISMVYTNNLSASRAASADFSSVTSVNNDNSSQKPSNMTEMNLNVTQVDVENELFLLIKYLSQFHDSAVLLAEEFIPLSIGLLRNNFHAAYPTLANLVANASVGEDRITVEVVEFFLQYGLANNSANNPHASESSNSIEEFIDESLSYGFSKFIATNFKQFLAAVDHNNFYHYIYLFLVHPNYSLRLAGLSALNSALRSNSFSNTGSINGSVSLDFLCPPPQILSAIQNIIIDTRFLPNHKSAQRSSIASSSLLSVPTHHTTASQSMNQKPQPPRDKSQRQIYLTLALHCLLASSNWHRFHSYIIKYCKQVILNLFDLFQSQAADPAVQLLIARFFTNLAQSKSQQSHHAKLFSNKYRQEHATIYHNSNSILSFLAETSLPQLNQMIESSNSKVQLCGLIALEGLTRHENCSMKLLSNGNEKLLLPILTSLGQNDSLDLAWKRLIAVAIFNLSQHESILKQTGLLALFFPILLYMGGCVYGITQEESSLAEPSLESEDRGMDSPLITHRSTTHLHSATATKFSDSDSDDDAAAGMNEMDDVELLHAEVWEGQNIKTKIEETKHHRANTIATQSKLLLLANLSSPVASARPSSGLNSIRKRQAALKQSIKPRSRSIRPANSPMLAPENAAPASAGISARTIAKKQLKVGYDLVNYCLQAISNIILYGSKQDQYSAIINLLKLPECLAKFHCILSLQHKYLVMDMIRLLGFISSFPSNVVFFIEGQSQLLMTVQSIALCCLVRQQQLNNPAEFNRTKFVQEAEKIRSSYNTPRLTQQTPGSRGVSFAVNIDQLLTPRPDYSTIVSPSNTQNLDDSSCPIPDTCIDEAMYDISKFLSMLVTISSVRKQLIEHGITSLLLRFTTYQLVDPFTNVNTKPYDFSRSMGASKNTIISPSPIPTIEHALLNSPAFKAREASSPQLNPRKNLHTTAFSARRIGSTAASAKLPYAEWVRLLASTTLYHTLHEVEAADYCLAENFASINAFKQLLKALVGMEKHQEKDIHHEEQKFFAAFATKQKSNETDQAEVSNLDAKYIDMLLSCSLSSLLVLINHKDYFKLIVANHSDLFNVLLDLISAYSIRILYSAINTSLVYTILARFAEEFDDLTILAKDKYAKPLIQFMCNTAEAATERMNSTPSTQQLFVSLIKAAESSRKTALTRAQTIEINNNVNPEDAHRLYVKQHNAAACDVLIASILSRLCLCITQHQAQSRSQQSMLELDNEFGISTQGNSQDFMISSSLFDAISQDREIWEFDLVRLGGLSNLLRISQSSQLPVARSLCILSLVCLCDFASLRNSSFTHFILIQSKLLTQIDELIQQSMTQANMEKEAEYNLCLIINLVCIQPCALYFLLSVHAHTFSLIFKFAMKTLRRLSEAQQDRDSVLMLRYIMNSLYLMSSRCSKDQFDLTANPENEFISDRLTIRSAVDIEISSAIPIKSISWPQFDEDCCAFLLEMLTNYNFLPNIPQYKQLSLEILVNLANSSLPNSLLLLQHSSLLQLLVKLIQTEIVEKQDRMYSETARLALQVFVNLSECISVEKFEKLTQPALQLLPSVLYCLALEPKLIQLSETTAIIEPTANFHYAQAAALILLNLFSSSQLSSDLITQNWLKAIASADFSSFPQAGSNKLHWIFEVVVHAAVTLPVFSARLLTQTALFITMQQKLIKRLDQPSLQCLHNLISLIRSSENNAADRDAECVTHYSLMIFTNLVMELPPSVAKDRIIEMNVQLITVLIKLCSGDLMKADYAFQALSLLLISTVLRLEKPGTKLDKLNQTAVKKLISLLNSNQSVVLQSVLTIFTQLSHLVTVDLFLMMNSEFLNDIILLNSTINSANTIWPLPSSLPQYLTNQVNSTALLASTCILSFCEHNSTTLKLLIENNSPDDEMIIQQLILTLSPLIFSETCELKVRSSALQLLKYLSCSSITFTECLLQSNLPRLMIGGVLTDHLFRNKPILQMEFCRVLLALCSQVSTHSALLNIRILEVLLRQLQIPSQSDNLVQTEIQYISLHCLQLIIPFCTVEALDLQVFDREILMKTVLASAQFTVQEFLKHKQQSNTQVKILKKQPSLDLKLASTALSMINSEELLEIDFPDILKSSFHALYRICVTPQAAQQFLQLLHSAHPTDQFSVMLNAFNGGDMTVQESVLQFLARIINPIHRAQSCSLQIPYASIKQFLPLAQEKTHSISFRCKLFRLLSVLAKCDWLQLQLIEAGLVDAFLNTFHEMSSSKADTADDRKCLQLLCLNGLFAVLQHSEENLLRVSSNVHLVQFLLNLAKSDIKSLNGLFSSPESLTKLHETSNQLLSKFVQWNHGNKNP
jgi:hypothetical protein